MHGRYFASYKNFNIINRYVVTIAVPALFSSFFLVKMAIFENSLFSSIPDSNIGGIHVLNHSLATMDSGSSRGGGKIFLIPKFNSMPSQQALEVSFYAVL